MPVVFGKNETKNIPQCCEEEMKVAGRWFHCFKCGLKLIQVKNNETKPIVQELLSEIVRENEMRYKELEPVIHEIWKNNYYEDSIGNIPKEWIE